MLFDSKHRLWNKQRRIEKPGREFPIQENTLNADTRTVLPIGHVQKETMMPNKANLLLATAMIAPLLFVAGCGSSRKTVVVNPPPGSTVVVPSDNDSHTKVIPAPPPPPDDNY